jgi:hypothetical protein
MRTMFPSATSRKGEAVFLADLGIKEILWLACKQLHLWRQKLSDESWETR